MTFLDPIDLSKMSMLPMTMDARQPAHRTYRPVCASSRDGGSGASHLDAMARHDRIGPLAARQTVEPSWGEFCVLIEISGSRGDEIRA